MWNHKLQEHSWFFPFRQHLRQFLGPQLSCFYSECSTNLFADWPPISGASRRDACCLTKLWGRAGTSLDLVVKQEELLKRYLDSKRGSFASRYSKIWRAFVVSVFLHHMGAVVGMFEGGGCLQILYFCNATYGNYVWGFWWCGSERNWEYLTRKQWVSYLNVVQIANKKLI
jgi:hypothetical protein